MKRLTCGEYQENWTRRRSKAVRDIQSKPRAEKHREPKSAKYIGRAYGGNIKAKEIRLSFRDVGLARSARDVG